MGAQPQYPSVFAQHHSTGAAAPIPTGSVPALPVPTAKGRNVGTWVFGLLGFGLLCVLAFTVFILGPAAPLIGFFLALVPLVIVFFAIRLIDRWEPEPPSLIFFALAWGGVGAVILSLVVGMLFDVVLPSNETTDMLMTVVEAPVVEELFKGIGVLLVFFIGRRAFDGPVDGVVYGMLVGAGFAFTENILYFGSSILEGGGVGATLTFVVRGVMSPFAHTMFTGITGFMLGLAARRGANANVAGMFILGLLGAMALHAVWNGSIWLIPGWGWYGFYFLVQVPLFVLAIWFVTRLRREEARLTKERLGEYARAGWFTPQEVEMLATPAGRRAGLSWASQLPGNRAPVMKRFIADATNLAATRQRAVSGRDPLAGADEQALLVRTTAARQTLLAR